MSGFGKHGLRAGRAGSVERLEARTLLNAGDVDPTFGAGGYTTLPGTVAPYFEVSSCARGQVDGKTVVAGQASGGLGTVLDVARLNGDGTRDGTFGVNGNVLTRVMLAANTPTPVAIGGDGKIVAAGSTAGGDFVVMRFNADGMYDATFNGTGRVVVNLGSTDIPAAVAVGADGSVVVVGSSGGSTQASFATLRLTPGGVPDTAFNGTGFSVVAGKAGKVSTLTSINFLSGGGLLVVGTRTMIRYLSDGTPDATFGIGGVATMDTGFAYTLQGVPAVSVQADGKILAVGGNSVSYSTSPLFERFNADGTFDNTYHDNGFFVGPALSWQPTLTYFAFTGDGKIDVAAQEPNDLDVFRYLPDGTLDGTFNVTGYNRVAAVLGGAQVKSIDVSASGAVTLATFLFHGFGLEACRFLAGGQQDSAFGGGFVDLTVSGPGAASFGAVGEMSDGKIVATALADGNQFDVARYLPDGTPDPSMGTNGVLVIQSSSSWGVRYAWPLANGQFLLGGSKPYGSTSSSFASFLLERINADGSIDPTFGTNGVATLLIGTAGQQDSMSGLVVDSGGNILFTGLNTTTSTGVQRGVLARFLPGGTPDPSFGNNGVAFTASAATPAGVYLQGNGGILVTAMMDASGANRDFGLMRFTSAGVADTSFGTSGLARTDFAGKYDTPCGLVIQGDGGILVGGTVNIPAPTPSQPNAVQTRYGLARYLANGQLDSGFGTSGKLTGSVGDPTTTASLPTALAQQPDGRLILAGQTLAAGVAEPFIVRLGASGAPDTTFGVGGVVTTAAGAGPVGRWNAVRLDHNGRILAAGDQTLGGVSVPAVARSRGAPGPVAVLAHGYAVPDDGSITLSAAGSYDHDGDIVRYEWDYNYDGVTFHDDAEGASPVLSATDLATSPTHTVALRLSDDLGYVDVATAGVVIVPSGRVTGTAGDDVITLARDADGVHIDWRVGGTSARVAADDPAGLTLDGNGGTDQVVLDSTRGNPLPLSLRFNGTFVVTGLAGSTPLVGVALDVGRSTVYVGYESAASDPIAAIKAALGRGFDGGTWTGTPTGDVGAITSTDSRNDPLHRSAVGYSDWADGTGVNAVPNTILLKYAVVGDADLDGTVGLADYTNVVRNFGVATDWDRGAFTYGASVGLADYTSVVRNFGANAAPAAAPVATSFTQPQMSPVAVTSSQAAGETEEPARVGWAPARAAAKRGSFRAAVPRTRHSAVRWL